MSRESDLTQLVTQMSRVRVEAGTQIWDLSWVRVESPGLSHESESSQPEKSESSTTLQKRHEIIVRKIIGRHWIAFVPSKSDHCTVGWSKNGGNMTFFRNPEEFPKFVTGHEKHFLWKFHQNRPTLEPGLRAQKSVLTEVAGVKVTQC